MRNAPNDIALDTLQRRVPLRRSVLRAAILGAGILGAALLTATAWCGQARADDSKAPLPRAGFGAIGGHLAYRADPERPWRLGRYYVRPRDGRLAEAVVALHRRGLKLDEPNREPVVVTVDQKNFQFSPETVALRTGDRIKFLNSDDQAHNVRASHPRHAFNVTLQPGGEHIETFAAASGIRQPIRIGCAFHSAMRSWAFVFDHPWHQVTAADGEFQLRDIPPGEYLLEILHPAGELRLRRAVTVKPDRAITFELQLSPENLVNR